MDAPNGMRLIVRAYIMLRQTAQIACVDAGFHAFDGWVLCGSRR
jgi:hypothetical protein